MAAQGQGGAYEIQTMYRHSQRSGEADPSAAASRMRTIRRLRILRPGKERITLHIYIEETG